MAEMHKSNSKIWVIDRQDFTKSVIGKEINFRIPNLPSFQKYKAGEKIQDSQEGVYALLNKNHVFYIGQSYQINQRLYAHSRRFNYDAFLFYREKDPWMRNAIERILIWKHRPRYNIEIEGEL